MEYPAGRPDDPAEAGQPLVDRGQDPELAELLDQSAELLEDGPDELTMERHLRAMRSEAGRSGHLGHAGRGAGADRGRAGMRLAGAAVAAGFALVATLAGLGSLPAPAQQVMADVAERVGLTLPPPADEVVDGTPAADIVKQRPVFDPTPGAAIADERSQGRAHGRGFPKPDGQPGRVGPPEGVPGVGPDERGRSGADRPDVPVRDEAPGPESPPGQDVAPDPGETPDQDLAPGSADEPARDGTPGQEVAPGQTRERDQPDETPDDPPDESRQNPGSPPGQDGESPPGQPEDPGPNEPSAPSDAPPVSEGGQGQGSGPGGSQGDDQGQGGTPSQQ